jgi:lipopolysaccharide transport system ATP-binding protein
LEQPVIHVERLSKRYRLGQRQRYNTLRESLTSAVTGILHRGSRSRQGPDDPRAGSTQDEWIWSLRDVSFDVMEGEVLGIVGRNGAGKSTLLKVLSRVTVPSAGEVEIFGRVGSLLEVGTGFHLELTGRENIYLSGAILGMSKPEIESKFDAIVSFAETEQFIDTPVKRYSSGMYLRLAFAVAAHLEPEVLLLDEVLAVGDAGFQAKCLSRIRELRDCGATILLVSHNMASVLSFCTRALWLEKGELRAQGEPETVVQQYLASVNPVQPARTVALDGGAHRHGQGGARMTGLRLFDALARESDLIRTGQDLDIEIDYTVTGDRPARNLTVAVTIETETRQRLAFCQNTLVGREFVEVPARGTLACRIRRLPLTPGRYALSLALWLDGVAADGIYQAADFEVAEGTYYATPGLPSGAYGRVLLDYDWSIGRLAELA